MVPVRQTGERARHDEVGRGGEVRAGLAIAIEGRHAVTDAGERLADAAPGRLPPCCGEAELERLRGNRTEINAASGAQTRAVDRALTPEERAAAAAAAAQAQADARSEASRCSR